MRLLSFLFLVTYNLYSGQGQRLFIGQGTNSLYFAVRALGSNWDWGLNYCHNFRLMPGSIETEEDHALITNFLNTTTLIEDADRFFWLPATDHRNEGTFQWMWNMKEVVGPWVPGMPSMNRSANCLAINRHGQYMEEMCTNAGPDRNYHTLCEVPNFSHERRNDCDICQRDSNTKSIDNPPEYEKVNNLTLDVPQSLTFIGQVGNRVYFANNQMISWTESLDMCHAAGMRLATPELPEQFDFIQRFVKQAQFIYYVGGSDRLSVSCLKSNSEFRWFYSGNPIVGQNINGHFWWYLCFLMTPDDGPHGTGCARGGGAFAHAICEITIET